MFAVFLVDRLAFDEVDLAYVWGVDIAVQCTARPDTARFDSPVFARGDFDEIGGLPIAEVERDVLVEHGLVGFDGEVVMGVALCHEVAGEFALGEQGIRGDVLTFNRNGIEQRDGHADFVGLLERFGIALYGQGADFFWV